MNPIPIIQSQLLATKFYVPTSPRTLIRRSRLSALLERESQVSSHTGLGSRGLRQDHPLVHLGPILASDSSSGGLAVVG